MQVLETTSAYISTQKFDAVLLDDNLIENIIHRGVMLEKDDVLELKKTNVKLASKNKYCLLVTSKELASVSEEARAVSASKEFAELTIAKALMATSLGQQIIVNFYLKINKPHIKTRVFSEREKALAWLKSELKQHYGK